MLRFSVAVSIAIFISSAPQSSANFVDDFSASPITKLASVANYNSTETQTGVDTTNVILGQRRFTLQGDMVSGSVEASITNGQFLYTANSPVFGIFPFAPYPESGGRVILQYLPGDRFTAYNLPSLAPGDALAIDVLFADFGGKPSFRGQISLNGFDAVGTFTLHNSTTPYTLRIPYSSLTINPLTNGIRNLTIDFMDLDYGGILGPSSFALDSIRIVPEPTTILLFTLAGFSLLALRRR